MKPINRKEKFLNAILTGNIEDLPVPITREETYLDYIARNSGGGGGTGDGDMKKSVYDKNNNGIVDNAELVNGHSVAKDVPSNAKFTDTVYDDTEVRELIANKVDKVSGKGLSTNDYTDTDAGKVSALGTASTKNSTNSVTSGSTDLVESGAVKNAIDSALRFDYSTTEKVVGSWIDGKPLYQKTISCGELPNNTSKNIPSDLSNVLIRKISGYAYGPTVLTSGVTIPLPNANAADVKNSVGVDYIYSNNTIRIITGMDRTPYNESYVTLQYTKTTD